MERVLLQDLVSKNYQNMTAVSTKIYMTESQKLQYHRVCQMCGDYIE